MKSRRLGEEGPMPRQIVDEKGAVISEEPEDNYDPYDDEADDMDPDEEFLMYECGMNRNGQCSMAGSEDCDWRCPRSR